MTGWLLVSLFPNEMTNKTLTELFEIRNSSWGYLVKPYFGYSFQRRWEYPAHQLIWGHLHNINVLNDSMWSKGSLEPSYDSNCGRWNFDGRGRFSTSVVNGESVLQIIPSKFSLPLSFKRVWICCCCTASCYCTISDSITYFEELFCHWERWLEWLALPTNGAKLMMQKISSWAP